MTEMSGPLLTAAQASFPGELLAAVSRSLVQLYKECYGKGPTRARTHASENLVVCTSVNGSWRRSSSWWVARS